MQRQYATHAATRVERFLRVAVILIVSGFIGLFYWIALHRFSYPLPLEWNECAMVEMMRRVVSHQPVYAAPSKDYVPFLYTPVYVWLGALLSHVVGARFLALRLLSILATTGCFALIFISVRRKTGGWLAAWIACGLFAALYGRAGGWFDLARVDMLYVFFLLLAILLAQRGSTIWSALLFVVAFQTKQSAVVIAVFVLGAEFLRPRRLFSGLAVFAVGAGVSSWLLNLRTGGWYSYYVFHVPAHQALVKSQLVDFWLRELIDPLGVTIALIVAAGGLYLMKWPADRREIFFVTFTSAGVILSCLLSRVHMGGAVNTMLPLYAWSCILLGWGTHQLMSQANQQSMSLGPVLRAAVLSAVMIQFFQLVYAPRKFLPTAAQRENAARVLDRLSAFPGKIFVMHQEIDAGAAGKPEFAEYWEVWDVLRADHGPVGQKLDSDIIASFRNHDYAAVVSDRPLDESVSPEDGVLKDIRAAAAEAYPKQERLLSPSEAQDFYANPSQLEPEFLYLPR